MGIHSNQEKKMSGKVAIVTGGNKGIGYAIVKGLVENQKFETVYLTARNPELGRASVEKIKAETGKEVQFHQLDVADSNSVDTFRDYIEQKHGGFDVFIQNAGFAFKGSATEPRPVQAKETFRINFWGLLDVIKKFYPLTRENGRHVLMSSFVSQMAEFGFTPRWGNPYQKELGQLNKDLKLERLEELAHQYQADCEAGKDEEKGWPSTSYAISKLFVNGVCRAFARQAKADNNGVLINCCSPGFVQTDMTSQNSAGLPLEVGARTSIWLAELPAGMDGPQGCYLAEI